MLMVKEELLAEIEQLPDHRLAELLAFVRYILYQEQQRHQIPPTDEDQEDPWANFIGAASYGPLAQSIDDELYGE
jgi:hypothetical protein